MRERTSLSQACGSTPFILQVTMRLYIAVARCPPRSEPQNSQDFLPRAIPLPLSAALLDRQPGARHRDFDRSERAGQRPRPAAVAVARIGACVAGASLYSRRAMRGPMDRHAVGSRGSPTAAAIGCHRAGAAATGRRAGATTCRRRGRRGSRVLPHRGRLALNVVA